jgi:hypothetical protein
MESTIVQPALRPTGGAPFSLRSGSLTISALFHFQEIEPAPLIERD